MQGGGGILFVTLESGCRTDLQRTVLEKEKGAGRFINGGGLSRLRYCHGSCWLTREAIWETTD